MRSTKASAKPEPRPADPVEEAAHVVARGGVIVFPTDTLWGMGASIEDLEAIRRVFTIKKRPTNEPLSIALADIGLIPNYAEMTSSARRLCGLLPGPLTIVLTKRRTVPDLVTGGRDHVAIRVPGNRECLRLLSLTGPVTATSANLHGAPDPRTLDEVERVFGNQVDFYLPSNTPMIGTPSTIVDARADSVKILRTGAIVESRIRQILTQ